MPNDHSIPLTEAVAMTRKYREEKDKILDTPYKGSGILPFYESFDRESILALLAEPSCAGIRIYLGMDENMLVKVIIVGTDGNEQDILPSNSTEVSEKIVEMGRRCPTICSSNSVLAR
jgi:hypothetical protein